MNTKDALIIVCDPKDRDMGIGMDENRFIEWMGREKADIQASRYSLKMCIHLISYGNQIRN